MSQVAIQGNASGSGVFTVASPNSNNSRTFNLPDATGTAVLDSATQTLTNKTLTSPTITGGTAAGTQIQGGAITSDTAKASTSGTSVDFTGIPSWVKRVTLSLSGVSTASGSSPILIQIGTGSTPTTSGYSGVVGLNSGSGVGSSGFSTGFALDNTDAAANIRVGQLVLTLLNSSTNLWVVQGTVVATDSLRVANLAGSVALSGVLGMVRMTTVSGANAFDAGSINILYEG